MRDDSPLRETRYFEKFQLGRGEVSGPGSGCDSSQAKTGSAGAEPTGITWSIAYCWYVIPYIALHDETWPDVPPCMPKSSLRKPRTWNPCAPNFSSRTWRPASWGV